MKRRLKRGWAARRAGFFSMPSLLMVVLVTLLLTGCGGEREPDSSVAEVMAGGERTGFRRADTPRAFRFPEDHGPHRGFRHEWWYFTGHLETEGGDQQGFHLTLFRAELEPEPVFRRARDAADAEGWNVEWTTNEVWMGHAAWLSDARREHRSAERFARGAAGLAGADPAGERVWIEDWSVAGMDGDTWSLSFGFDAVQVDLALVPERRPVLQGDAGRSQKGRDPGNASYYYSVPRLALNGHVEVDGMRESVRGTAWLDREWSTSALDDDQLGWDWFSLQFDDGRDLMLYQMRRSDGGRDPRSKGRLIEPQEAAITAEGLRPTPEGAAHPVLGRLLTSSSFDLEPYHWATMPSGRRYPVAWRVEVNGIDAALAVEAVFPEQEMRTSIPYWEGRVIVRDAEGRRLGQGFLEMTGY